MMKKMAKNKEKLRTGEVLKISCPADGSKILTSGTIQDIDRERLTIRIDNNDKLMTLSKGDDIHLTEEGILYRIINANRFPIITAERVSRRKNVRVEDVLRIDYGDVTDLYKCENKTEPDLIFEKTFGEEYKIPDVGEVKAKDLYELVYLVNLKMDKILEILKSKETEGITRVSHEDVNISASGIRFAAHGSFRVNDIFAIKISLPLKNNTGIKALGRVVSVNRTNVPEKYSVSFEFIDLAEDERELLTKYVFQRQRELIRKEGLQGVHSRL